MATDRNPQESTPQAPIVFVEKLGSMPAAGLKWREDVRKGKSVHYCTKDGCYLGCTGSSSELDTWLSNPAA